MSEHGAEPAPGAPSVEHLDYRIAHLSERLAVGNLGELGVRVDMRGEAVLLTGTVPSSQCRDDVLRIAREVLAGHPVHCDIGVAESSAPDRAEELT